MSPYTSATIEDSMRMIDQLTEMADNLTQHTNEMRARLDELAFMTLVSATDSVIPPEVFVRVGGDTAVKKAVRLLYGRVMADPHLRPFFEGANMVQIRSRQVEMFLAIFGRQDYEGINLGLVHEHLDIRQADFDMLVEHVQEVLSEIGLTPEEAALVVEQVKAFEPELVKEASG